MDSFLLTFFPSVLRKEKELTNNNIYCKKWSVFRGGTAFILGATIAAMAANLVMLILGRFLLGVGVGYAIQSVPIYLSEMAPAKHRGMLDITFQLMVTLGILGANIVNYLTHTIEGGWGWRLSLVLAITPAIIVAAGLLVLPETPNSLVERRHDEEAKVMLCLIRGVEDIPTSTRTSWRPTRSIRR